MGGKIKQYNKLASVVLVSFLASTLFFAGYIEFAAWLIRIFSVIVALYLSRGMISTIKSGKYGIDILAIMAIASTLAVNEYWATLVIVAMLVGGEALETFAANRATSELKSLLSHQPKTAKVILKGGQIVEIKVKDIKVDMLIAVQPGDVLPVDAIVEEGSGYLDESSITGESLPIEVSIGSKVLSGSVNGGSLLKIRATSTAAKSQYSQIVELVRSATNSNAPFVRLADKYSVPFTVISITIASLGWYFSGDAKIFAEVLVLATPCPLLIAAPVAIISGMSAASRRGIIIKSGAVLEQLADVKTAVFDKTGTLTENILEIDKILCANGSNEKDLITLVASIEKQSNHVLALAINDYAFRHKLKLKSISNQKEEAGNGIKAIVSGKIVLVGSERYLMEHNINLVNIHSQSKTAIYVAADNKYIGAITFKDSLRHNSIRTIKKLRKLGIKNFGMLTGDNQQTADRLANAIGIDKVIAECLPSDKLNALHKFRSKPVMMIGDGVNDAPVLAAADVGVAMGSRGETAASESADVVIMHDDIYRVAESIAIAGRAMRIARQSVGVGIGLSVILMLIATRGVIPAFAGAGLQELVDVTVILNALRAHKLRGF